MRAPHGETCSGELGILSRSAGVETVNNVDWDNQESVRA